jgi:threonylcarbamoyladenosine tRNA methylthiotransferase MtaB
MELTKSVAFHTLGCKLNFSETSTLSRTLEANGFVEKQFDDIADIYVINTCSVTENADKECRQIVRKIQKKSPESFVVITGCYAQLKPEEIANIEGVDLVLGAAEKFNIVTHLNELTQKGNPKIYSCDIEEVHGFNASYSHAHRTRTFLKVQDGCDYNCSFCTIPLARGHSRSDSISNVISKIDEIASQGVKEIVLTGINLGDFGKGFDGGKKREESFFELMQAIENHNGVERYRISSIEPNLLTEDMIRLVGSSSKFMPHFHIPLQSGSNKILGLMKRRYQRELYKDRIDLIKKVMPKAAIGVDVIVGFPSESEEDFKETFDFLHNIDVSYFHVFTYSEREQTHALEIQPIVPIHKRNERNKVLRNLSHQKQQYFNLQSLGETRKVLWESANKNGLMEGYTDNYIKVQAPYNENWINTLMDWELR